MCFLCALVASHLTEACTRWRMTAEAGRSKGRSKTDERSQAEPRIGLLGDPLLAIRTVWNGTWERADQLCQLANTHANEVLQYAERLAAAENAAQLATAVDRMAAKLAETSAAWHALARQIRENWYR